MMQEKRIDLTKVPLAFAEGGTLKKAAQWNQKNILDGGTLITAAVIAEFDDVSLYIPTSLRIEKSVDHMNEMVESNIRKFKNRQKTDKMQDLSQTYIQGEIIFQQGDRENKDCFFIVEGSFDVIINNQKIVTLSEPGSPVGEMSFLTGEPRSATLIASGPSKLLRICEKDKKKILASNPTIVNTLLEVLVTRLSDTSHRLVDAKVTADRVIEDEEALKESLEKEVRESLSLQNEIASLLEKQNETDSIRNRQQNNMENLARYAAYEAGVKKGNQEILKRLIGQLERECGNTTVISKENPAFLLLKDYLIYLESQQTSATLKSVTFPDSFPEGWTRILQS